MTMLVGKTFFSMKDRLKKAPSPQVYYLYNYFVAQNSIEVRFRNCPNQFFIRIGSKLASYLDSSVRNIINR